MARDNDDSLVICGMGSPYDIGTIDSVFIRMDSDGNMCSMFTT